MQPCSAGVYLRGGREGGKKGRESVPGHSPVTDHHRQQRRRQWLDVRGKAVGFRKSFTISGQLALDKTE